MSEPVLKLVIRKSDINPDDFIKIMETTGGDILVSFGDSKTFHRAGVEFSMSGSQSPKTREAFRALIDVISNERTTHK